MADRRRLMLAIGPAPASASNDVLVARTVDQRVATRSRVLAATRRRLSRPISSERSMGPGRPGFLGCRRRSACGRRIRVRRHRRSTGLAGHRVHLAALADMLSRRVSPSWSGSWAATPRSMTDRAVGPIGIVNMRDPTRIARTVPLDTRIRQRDPGHDQPPSPFPLDGGHSRSPFTRNSPGTGRYPTAGPDRRRVIGIFAFLGFVAIILDIVDPISL